MWRGHAGAVKLRLVTFSGCFGACTQRNSATQTSLEHLSHVWRTLQGVVLSQSGTRLAQADQFRAANLANDALHLELHSHSTTGTCRYPTQKIFVMISSTRCSLLPVLFSRLECEICVSSMVAQARSQKGYSKLYDNFFLNRSCA